MKLDAAINRLIWRFGEFDHIYINEKDITAINKIVDFVNFKQERTFQENLHFAKLYTYNLGYFLEKYNTTIDKAIAHRELHHLLDKPFENYVEDLTSQINLSIKYNVLNKAGCKLDKHPASESKIEKSKNLNSLKRLLEDDDVRRVFIGDAWNKKEVEAGLKVQINNFLNGI
ncbi:hypothetical protein [Costertonia aggregata]|uniref:Uncharacterized protein n=1 Tax=Costertonia aggregata TaxID=343403 RepID=A0A7H9AMA1_9FLAO|nr:hypothetical protein [Costertonia aggregata]QLG44586.1 hypothetical protein HYG79_04230 [Costertonia aggregata]